MATRAARRKPSKARPRATKRPVPAPWLSDAQRREIVGLAVAATGILLGMFRYAGEAGGSLGARLLDLSRILAGRLSLILPVVLVLLGAGILTNARIVAARPFRLGFALVATALFASLGAGLLGLSAAPTEWFAADAMMTRAGIPGSALGWTITLLLGRPGATVVVGLLLVAGLVLTSGASLETFVRRSGKRAASAGVVVARGVGATTHAVVRESRRIGSEVRARWESSERTTVGAARTSPRGLVDGADDFPDLYSGDGELPPSPALVTLDDDDPMPSIPVPTRPPPDRLFDVDDRVAAPVPRPESAVRRANGLKHPSPRLLKRSTGGADQPASLIAETSRCLQETLGHFGVQATVVGTVSGPRVTRYELQLAPGTKVSRVTTLRDDLAYALAAREEIRILAPIPGKQAVGVEVPNPTANLVTLGDIYRNVEPDAGPLVAWLGLDLGGKPVHIDIARMPHVLIAGSTGTGKSVCLNALLASLLLRSGPDLLRMVLIDPKKVELNHYDRIPHLLTPVVTNMKNATAVLANLVGEMESRYSLMGAARARNLRDWNDIRAANGEEPLPAILVLIDELADLMMVAPAEVEDAIIRLAQKSRAVGIHLVLATQRPSVDVITGMIKANVPSRIAFAVSSQVDSRVVLDANGAESLLGHGDMLFRPVGSSRLQRLQGAYVSEEEILAITDHWRGQGQPVLREELLQRPEPAIEDPLDPHADELLHRAMDLVVSQGTASVSLLQRRLGVGYARAGRLVDMMEQLGVVSGHEGSKPRTVLMGPSDIARFRAPDVESAVDDGDRSAPMTP
ncbi:MAG: DNA translocase FtsK [Actinobacteria bacterium]|nr:DNA translocase FtsK [Actinomycetota bacterium]